MYQQTRKKHKKHENIVYIWDVNSDTVKQSKSNKTNLILSQHFSLLHSYDEIKINKSVTYLPRESYDQLDFITD